MVHEKYANTVMFFNPKIHHRRSIRLREYDYTQPGEYFVTIRTHGGECVFGDVAGGKMVLNANGKIVEHQFRQISRFFPNCGTDEFTVMPDHFHGIVVIHADDIHTDSNGSGGFVGAKHPAEDSLENSHILPGGASPLQIIQIRDRGTPHRGMPQHIRPQGTVPGSLSAIMQNFTSVTTRKINRIRKTPGRKLWQRNYYEHVVRNDADLIRIREYIRSNPANWQDPNDEPASALLERIRAEKEKAVLKTSTKIKKQSMTGKTIDPNK